MNSRANPNLLAKAAALALVATLAAGSVSAQPARIDGKPNLNGVNVTES